MRAQPLVTIVTPSYNHRLFIKETIESVFNQTYPNVEYIIIDGASQDGTVDIIRNYEDRVAYWVSEPDQGQTDAINKGLSMAKGEIIAWLNSDDTLFPLAVEEAVAYLSEHSEVGLVYGNAHYIDKDSRVIGDFPAAQTSLAQLRRGYVHIPQQASFFRKTLWDQVGPLDPSFYFAMDYDLWVRLAAISQIKYLPSLWANFRLHEDAKTISADDQCWPEMLRVHYRDGGKWFSPIVIKYYIRKIAAPVIRWRRKQLFKKE